MSAITPYGLDMVCDLTDREWRKVELRLMLLTEAVGTDPSYDECRTVEVRQSKRHDYVSGGVDLFIAGWDRSPGRRELRIKPPTFTVTKGSLSARWMVAVHDDKPVSVHDFDRTETVTARKGCAPATLTIALPNNALIGLSSLPRWYR